MNQIKDPPLTYDFGLDFNYAVWTAGTYVTLVNVPWNNDYRDIVRFADRSVLNAYIDSRAGSGITIPGMSYLKPNQPVRINVPFNQAYKYNYLRASNPIQPIPGSDVQKDYYYFIIDVRYLAPNTTEVIVQLDVWQTFGYDVKFGNCYVERGHIGIANENFFDNYGRDYLTVPEGLDTGSDLNIVASSEIEIMATGQGGQNVLVCSTTDLSADPGTVEAPVLITAGGGTFGGVPSGASFYIFASAYSFSLWLGSRRTAPWVTQGIISADVIPEITDYDSSFVFPADGVPALMTPSAPSIKNYTMMTNWRQTLLDSVDDRYSHLLKFLVSPYSSVELTTLTGNPITLKPELWDLTDAHVEQLSTFLPPGAKISIYPVFYNRKGSATGEDLDVATHLGSFPEIAVVNNGAMSYLAANKNAILWQRSSADWSQQRALGSNQASYDVQTSAMNTARALTDIGISSDINQTANINRTQAVQAGIGAAQGLIGSTIKGSVGGPAGAGVGVATGGVNAAAGMAQMGVQLGANNEALAIRNAQAGAVVNAQNAQSGFARDTNKNLADWAARGDYGNSIAGVNAKVQDAQMIQPTVSGQFGGETLNYVKGNFSIVMRIKMIDLASIRTVGEYWLRYGYAIRKFLVPPANLMVMTKFTYWKMQETYLTGAPMPETFKQAIRGIFEKGVTVWANPSDIGNLDIADNDSLPGISY